jgi:hypothetical protein
VLSGAVCARSCGWTRRSAPDASRNCQSLRTAANRAALGRLLGRGSAVQGRSSRAWTCVFHRYPPAECDWFAAHRAHARSHGDRYPYALASHARVQHAVLAGHGPRRNFHATRGGAATGGPRRRLPQAGSRRVHQARLAMERRKRRHDSAPDEADWRVLRLVTREVHPIAGAFAGRARSLRQIIRRRIDLP